MLRKLHGLRIGFVALLLAVSVTSCSAERTAEPIVAQHSSGIVPDDTLEDLVTYGDLAVVFTVVSEQELAPTQVELERGEGTITRQVTARQTSAPLWERPSWSDPVDPPTEWQIADGGWVFNGSERRRIVDADRSDPLEVGHTYVAIRTYSSVGGKPREWFSLQRIPLDDGRVRFSEGTLASLDPTLARLQGMTDKAVGLRLTATPPNVKALPYMELDAAERFQRVVS